MWTRPEMLRALDTLHKIANTDTDNAHAAIEHKKIDKALHQIEASLRKLGYPIQHQ